MEAVEASPYQAVKKVFEASLLAKGACKSCDIFVIDFSFRISGLSPRPRHIELPVVATLRFNSVG